MTNTTKNLSESKGFAITSMICGIVGLVFVWNATVAFILAVVALVFGIISLVQKRGGRGMAIAGIVTAAVSLLGGILILLVAGAFVAALL